MARFLVTVVLSATTLLLGCSGSRESTRGATTASRQPSPGERTIPLADFTAGTTISPDGAILASTALDYSALFLLSLRTGQVLRAMHAEGQENIYPVVAFSGDGATIAALVKEEAAWKVSFWDVETGQAAGASVNVSRVPGAGIGKLAFVSEDRVLAIGSQTGVWLADRVGPQKLRRFGPLVDFGGPLAVSPDHAALAFGEQAGTIVQIFIDADPEQAGIRSTQGERALAAAYSSDGRVLASTGESGDITLADAATGNRQGLLKSGPTNHNTLAFSPDGRFLATDGTKGLVQLWDLPTGKLAKTYQMNASVSAVFFSPDSRSLIARGDEQIRFWPLP